MSITRRLITTQIMLMAMIALLVASGCKKDEQPVQVPRVTTYALVQNDVLGITGQVKFTKTVTTLTIDITLTGAPTGVHPAELRMNTAIEGGAIVLSLMPVDETGKSSTVVTSMTYDQLIAYDGFIQVSKSSIEPDIILAQGDIGGNVITNTSKTYALDKIGSFGVSGTALFQKRLNGNTILTITVTGTIAGEIYPATINLGSITTVGGGPVAKALNNVDGTNGKSITNIRTLDSGLAISYDNWLVYDGYINIYQSSVGLGNIICHGNIGTH